MSEFSRLKFLCRRGIKELDIILSIYLEKCYNNAPENEQQAFKSLLEMEDPQLFALVLEMQKNPDTAQNTLLNKLRTIIKDR